MLSFFCAVILAANIYTGCGGNSDEAAPGAILTVAETVIAPDDGTLVVDNDDSYYIALEQKLNEELDISRAPDKCAAQGLTKIVLNFTTDEIQTCSTYDLSKTSATAYFSDKTAEVVTPIWSIYSGGGTLAGTIYTATNKPAIIVFKALYSENGISKLALFRLTVTGLISISLNKTTDEIQLPATYDLSTELIVTAKLSNGTTMAIVKGDPNLKWTLSSGAGTLADGVYTPSAKVENATFTANYTENGVAKAAKFKLKVAGLSSLILSKTTDEVNSCETYDLASKIIVSNKLSNGTINDITSSPDLTWTLSSGSGILDSKVYTAPAKAETAVFTASYTEAGITKTAQFRLKVTGLSSVVLDKTTDEIMLPATYDLASEVNAIVKFSDGDSKSVDLIWALSSGSGNLSGSLYTPAAKTETAVFIGSYTENGITKTAQFKLKVIGLSSLTLSKTTDEVVSCATYDLSQIIVNDKLSNGTINNITNSTTWKLISGFGTLSDTTYTAPARAETAAFTANYTEAGITKTVQFRLKVIALASIKLSKATDEAQILAPYDLASNIVATAKLSNGQTRPVPRNDPNLKWTLSYGSGILSGTIYTPPERIETAVLTATYTENGVAQSAQLRLKSSATLRGKIELVGLTLEQTTDSVRIGQTYDLSKLVAIAKFADKTTAEVSLSWIVSSGGGSITGTTYTAPNNVATVKLMGTFKALDGSARSVYFTLTIYGNEIYGNRGMVTMDGAKFHLTNGITVEIPPNSVDSDGIINITETSNFPCKQPNINVYNINADNQIYCAIIKIPVKSGACQNDYTMAYISDTSCPENPSSYYTCYPKGIIDDTVCVFIVGDNPTINFSPVHNVNRAEQTKPKVNLGKAIVKIECFDEDKAETCAQILNNTNKKEKKIKWPFYFQTGSTCYAANWLMLLKGYKADLSEHGFANIPLIIKKVGLGPEEGVKQFKEINWLLGKANSNYFTNSDIKYEEKTFDILKRTLKPNYTTDPRVFTYNVINSLDNNNPVMLNMVIHSMLIVGYSYNGPGNITKDDIRNEVTYGNLTFYVHNPNTAPFCEYRLTGITKEGDGREYNKHSNYDFTYYFLDSATLSQDSPNLYSIHIPNSQGIVFKNDSGDFGHSTWNFNYSSNNINQSVWDFITSSGCCWQNNKNILVNEFNDFNKITLNNIPVYNTLGATSCKLRIAIFKGEDDNDKNNVVYKNYYCNSYLNSLSAATNNIKTYDAILPSTLAFPEYYFTFDNEVNYKEFESSISAEDSKYLIQIALIKKATNKLDEKLDVDFDIDKNRILDKFTIGFLHRKLWISGPVKDGNKNIFKCMLGNDDVTNQMKFSYYQLVEGNEILTDLTTNSVIPNIGGTYKVVATALDTAPEYLKNRTAELDNVLMASLLRIIPQKNKIGIFEETMLYAKNNDQAVDPLWSIFGNTSDFLLGSLDISPFDSTVYVAPKFNAAPERTMQTTSANQCKYTAPGNPNTYFINAFYMGMEDTCAIEVMPTTITNDVKSTMYPDEVVPFTIRVEKVTESKEIQLTSTGGEITTVSVEFTPATYCQILKGTFKLSDSDNESKYTISASLKNYSKIPKVDKEISVLPRDVKVMPSPVIMICGQKQKFTAFVDNETKETNITWSIEGSGEGTIDNMGLYTAPNIAGTYTIKALYYGKFEGTAEVTVQAPPFKVTPSPVTVVYGQKTQFSSILYDVPVTSNVIWSIETQDGGSINSSGLYTAPYKASTCIVKAIYNNAFEATAEVIVQTPVLKLTPSRAALIYGQQQQFNVLVDNETTENNITWSVETLNGGTINASTGQYIAPNAAGTYIVKAMYYDVEATAEVIVQAPALKLSPSQATLIYGQQQQFNALVDNETTETGIAWSVEDSTGGSIDSTTGLYTASNNVGTYIVKALYSGVEATAEVTIQAPILKLTPATATLYTNDTQQFALLVNDKTQETEIQWSATGGTVGTNDGSYMAPDNAGTYVITAVFRTVEATAEVTVKEHEIKIVPPAAETNIGQQVQFIAFIDNATAETGISWSTDVMGGRVDQTGLYTAPSTPGIHRVTAKYQGVETSVEVTVNGLFLIPLTHQMRIDETFQFNLKYGANENTTTEVTAAALWKVIPEIGSVTNGLYDPSEIGNFEITAEYNGMIVTAEVTVTSADLKISPPSAVLNRSQQMAFKAFLDDATQETGIVWSVVSPNGGIITQVGVYTAPTQWGKYVIKASYQGIEATAEVRVNDERVQLTKDNVFLNVYGNPMKADGTPLYNYSSSTSFNVRVSGQDVSTVEISIAEGESLGRFVYSDRTYPVSGYPVNVRYSYSFYYTQNSTQPYYDTNEIIHLNVKCPENSNASIVIPVTIYQPQLSDTIEVDDGARKWHSKKIGYRNSAGVWSDSISYKSSSNFFHGLRLGTWKDNNLVGYVQNFYCGEGAGEHRFYYHAVGDVRNGLLYTKYVFADNLLSYDSSGWEYTWEPRYAPGTGYYIGTFQITNKVTEKYTRASINIIGWGAVPGSRVVTKYDGWVTP